MRGGSSGTDPEVTSVTSLFEEAERLGRALNHTSVRLDYYTSPGFPADRAYLATVVDPNGKVMPVNGSGETPERALLNLISRLRICISDKIDDLTEVLAD